MRTIAANESHWCVPSALNYSLDCERTHIRLVHLECLGNEWFEGDYRRTLFQIEEHVCQVGIEGWREHFVINQLKDVSSGPGCGGDEEQREAERNKRDSPRRLPLEDVWQRSDVP